MAHTAHEHRGDNDDDIFYLLNGIRKKTDMSQSTQHNANDTHLRTNTNGGTSPSKVSSTFDESDIEMFVDINGLPTDTFLESLKQDALVASEALDRKLVSDAQRERGGQSGTGTGTGNTTVPRDFTARRQEVHYQSRYLDSSSESDTEDHHYQHSSTAPHKKRNSFFQHLQKEKQQHGVRNTGGPSTRATPRAAKKKTSSLTGRKSRKKSPSTQARASNETPGHATPIPISTLKSPNYSKPTRGSTTSGLNYLSSSLDTGRTASRRGRGSAVTPRTTKKTKKGESVTMTTSRLRASQSSEGDTIAALNLTKQVEEKNDSLKLRLQGQLNSIRVLETQLAEAQHSIAVRDLELANALRRVTQLESREKEKLIRKEHDEEGLRRSGQKEDGKMYQMKTELVACQARFNDEKARRGRTEERLRVIKEHCDKQKARVVEVEEKNSELEGVLKILHEKLQKKKLEVKSSSKKINVARVNVVEKDTALQTCKNQLLRSDMCIKDLRQDNDRLKEELRLLRREANISDDKNRRNTLEIEVLRERQNATKLAYRLQNQNQNTSHLLASSNASADRTRDTTHSSAAGAGKRRSRSVSAAYNSTSDSNNNSNLSSAVSAGEGNTRPCPYSKSRVRSHSAHTKQHKSSPRRKHNTVPGASPDCKTCGSHVDLDSDTESSHDSSPDPDSDSSYDIDPLFDHHDNENAHINNRMPENLLPSEEDRRGSVVKKQTPPGDVSLLSDSSGMGEQFDRLQKMYARVQGNKKH